MFAEVGAALSGIKSAFEIAKGISTLKSEAEINQAIIEIQRVLLDAQAAALDDKQKIAELVSDFQKLKSQLNEIDDWSQIAKRYILTESEMGTYTYLLRPEFIESETSHQLCVACFNNGKKSILQGKRSLQCHNCGNTIRVAKSEPAHFMR